MPKKKTVSSKTPVKIPVKIPISERLVVQSREKQHTLPRSPEGISSSQDFLNMLELINIRKIICEIVQEEISRLGLLPSPSIVKPKKYTTVPLKLRPLMQKNTSTYNDDPMDIDLVRLENSKDLLAIEGTVNDSKIQVLADTCANISFISKKVCDELNIEIDTSKRHRITGASGLNETIGMARDITITLATDAKIKEDFAVISDYPHREMILSRNCLKRYNYDIHESRQHLALVCNGKNFFIPIVPDSNR